MSSSTPAALTTSMLSTSPVLSPASSSPTTRSSPAHSPFTLKSAFTMGHALLSGNSDIHGILQNLADRVQSRHDERKNKRKRGKKEKKEKKEKKGSVSAGLRDKSASWGAGCADAISRARSAESASASATPSPASSSGALGSSASSVAPSPKAKGKAKFDGSTSSPAVSYKPRRKRSVSEESRMSSSADDHVLPHRDRSLSVPFSSGEITLPVSTPRNKDVILRSHSATTASALERDPQLPHGKPLKTNNAGQLQPGARISLSTGNLSNSRSQSSPVLGQPQLSPSGLARQGVCTKSKAISKKSSTSPRASRTRSSSVGGPSASVVSPRRAPSPSGSGSAIHAPSGGGESPSAISHQPHFHQHHHSPHCRHHQPAISGPRSSLASTPIFENGTIPCRHAHSAPPSNHFSPIPSSGSFVGHQQGRREGVPSVSHERFVLDHDELDMLLSSLEESWSPASASSVPHMRTQTQTQHPGFLSPVADSRSLSTSPIGSMASTTNVQRRESFDMMSVTDTMQRVNLAKDEFDPLSLLELDSLCAPSDSASTDVMQTIPIMPTPPLEFVPHQTPTYAPQRRGSFVPIPTPMPGYHGSLMQRNANDEQYMRNLFLAIDAMPISSDNSNEMA